MVMKKVLGVTAALWCACCFNSEVLASQVNVDDEQFAQSEGRLMQKLEGYVSKADIRNTVEEVDFKLPTYSKTKWRYDQFLGNIKGCFDKVSGPENFQLSISNAFKKADYYNFTANVKKDITLALEKLYQKHQDEKKAQKKKK